MGRRRQRSGAGHGAVYDWRQETADRRHGTGDRCTSFSVALLCFFLLVVFVVVVFWQMSGHDTARQSQMAKKTSVVAVVACCCGICWFLCNFFMCGGMGEGGV